ncbi:gamma-aminobutyric acid type B receptor subunit 1-like [Asterias rubens]|uniref:gamma-aminobutyric acid type B receptor subunit 1-like n=1 Tax=Asterias rubens TaxID=7604 RepID=UPI0014554FB5|nr:gamma-aminobutyric acid type B receptor subunit 1-like [Asterias rubens]
MVADDKMCLFNIVASRTPVTSRTLVSAVLIAAVLSGLATRTCRAAKIPLPIMMINPGGSWIGIDRAMELARDDVNRQDGILDDYELQLVANYSNPMKPQLPNTGNAEYVLYSHIYDGPGKPMPFLLGSFYSEECEVLCQTTGQFDIIQIGNGAVSPSLSDRTQCKTYYRTVQSASQQNVPRLRLIQMYGWDKVAILRYSNVLFSSVMDSLRSMLNENNITIVANEMFEDSPASYVGYLKEKDARIIIGLFWDTEGRKVFCEAYKQGLYGPRYVWILRGVGYFSPGWVTLEDPLVSCTAEEMIKATEGVIITNWQFIPAAQEVSITGRTPSDFVEAYNAFAGSVSFGGAGSLFYDSVLTAALAMNNSIAPLRLVNKTLEDYTYNDHEMRDIFMNVLDNIYFVGVSGPLSFLEDGDRVGQFQIEQIKDGKAKVVGRFLSREDKFEWDDGGVYFLNGEPPHDEIRIEERLITLSSTGFATVCTLSALGIVLAFALLNFNVVMRKQKIIKLSSPTINNLIILGSIMTYISVVLNGVDEEMVGFENMDHLCRARLWMLSLGFTLGFGSMFSKTWRVHKIFMNKKLERRSVKDYQLVTMVGIFLLLESVYLGVWEVRPLQAVWESYPSQGKSEGDLLLIPVVQRCTRIGVSDLTWLAGIYIFNGIQLVFGLFLAYETRNVKIEALNDSKNIGMSVYNVFILSCMGAVFSLLMDPLRNETVFIVTSVCITVSTTTTLLIIFTPKIRDVIRNPGGTKITTMASASVAPERSCHGPPVATVMTVSGPASGPQQHPSTSGGQMLVAHR